MAVRTVGRALALPWLASLLALAGLASSQGAASQHAAPQGAVVIVGGALFDGTGAPPRSGLALVIEGERIAAIVDADGYTPPEGARVLDAAGATVLPGLINAHTHFTETFEDRRDHHLAHGVTSICNLAAGRSQMAQFDEVRRGDEAAARGLKAGPMVARAGGYPEVQWGEGSGLNVVGPTEAAAAVTELASLGADFIKVSLEPGPGGWPILDADELRAVTEAAHALGLGVIAHVEDAGYLSAALDGGVDAITHVPHRRGDGGGRRLPFSGSAAEPILDPDYAAAVDRMAAEGVVWIPTLDVLTGGRSGTLRSEGMLEAVRRFHRLGGRVAVGNDYPLGVTEPGVPFGEMALLLAAGLGRAEVLAAATRTSAEVCGHSDELGTLEVGKLADVLVVEGDPLADLAALGEPRWVLLGGAVAVGD